MTKKLTGNEIRQTFIDFFVEHGHTAVPSMSLVPGGDATLLFTNSGTAFSITLRKPSSNVTATFCPALVMASGEPAGRGHARFRSSSICLANLVR